MRPSINSSSSTPEALLLAWEKLKENEPRIYTRDAAEKLGVSEAQLIALRCPQTAHRLSLENWPTLLNGLMQFGPVMILVRNSGVVLEMDGRLAFTAKERFLLGTGEGLLFALASTAVASAFVVEAENWLKRGVLFFDAAGDSVCKIYLRDNAQAVAFDTWLKPWIAAEQSRTLTVADDAVSEEGKGLRAEDDAGESVPLDSYKTLLQAAAHSGEPVTFSLCNTGCHFSVTTPVSKPVAMSPWFNILDKLLHLHLREETVASAWLTKVNGTTEHRLQVALRDGSGATLLRLQVAGNGAAASEVLTKKGA